MGLQLFLHKVLVTNGDEIEERISVQEKGLVAQQPFRKLHGMNLLENDILILFRRWSNRQMQSSPSVGFSYRRDVLIHQTTGTRTPGMLNR